MKRPILTLEDGVEVLTTTGDVDAFMHGGGVLFREPRRREIFWTFWEPRKNGDKNFIVFTAPVPDNIIEYFKPDIHELMIISGLKKPDIIRLSRSKNPIERLDIVMLILDCNGPSRIDPNHEPKIVSFFELSKQWGILFGYDHNSTTKIECDDFIIRERDSYYECGSVDGKYLGKYHSYKEALCAVASCMRLLGRERSNLFKYLFLIILIEVIMAHVILIINRIEPALLIKYFKLVSDTSKTWKIPYFKKIAIRRIRAGAKYRLKFFIDYFFGTL